MSNTNEKVMRCFQCKENLTPESDGMVINEGTNNELYQCDDCHLMEFGTHIMEANLHFFNNKKVMNTNEKTQSAEEYIKDILGHDFSDRKAINAFCLAFDRYADQKNASLQSSISDLEAQNQAFTDRTTQLVCQLNDEKALLEAKCRAYEVALVKCVQVLKYFEYGLTDVREGSGEIQPMHFETCEAIELAEQALKPNEKKTQ